ncbi:ArsR/SmtB family transcription factor [Herbidospora cretacea]|uniref:ArsR/SmtB family transcription factor n=1 Tax=Herbidospora cretacea TaxID=28444 RepID=UPI00077463E9|nr:DUF5937 family protein [Herbidospora cretacea]
MAVEWSFTPGDVARLRFAFSPMWEVVASLRAVQGAALHPAQLPWLREVRDRLATLGLEELTGLVPAAGYLPDFLTPTPDTHQPDFADELALVRAADPEVARSEVARSAPRRAGVAARFAADPAGALAWTGDALEAYWNLVFAEFWPKVRGVLEADVLYRSRRLTEGGVSDLFAALHPSVTWHGDRLITHKDCIHLAELGGAGLVLLPSVFQRLDRVAIVHEPYRPMLIYPARGTGNLWARGPEEVPGALSALIGRTRARILTALETPASTSGLARVMELTPGAVSQHLTVLSDGGLVSRQRLGREVFYQRTPIGDALVGRP